MTSHRVQCSLNLPYGLDVDCTEHKHDKLLKMDVPILTYIWQGSRSDQGFADIWCGKKKLKKKVGQNIE